MFTISVAGRGEANSDSPMQMVAVVKDAIRKSHHPEPQNMLPDMKEPPCRAALLNCWQYKFFGKFFLNQIFYLDQHPVEVV